MSHSACGLPTPKTVCVRVALKEQRVQAATRARSAAQSRPASRAPDPRASPAFGASAISALAAALRRRTQVLILRAARYSLRSGLFMAVYGRAISPTQPAVDPQ